MTKTQDIRLCVVNVIMRRHNGYNIKHHEFEKEVYVQCDTLLNGRIEIVIGKRGGIHWISPKLKLVDYDIKNK